MFGRAGPQIRWLVQVARERGGILVVSTAARGIAVATWTGQRGGEIEEIRAGDIGHVPADQWHWPGAAPHHFMTHLSITEAVPDRPDSTWGEHVTGEEYVAG